VLSDSGFFSGIPATAICSASAAARLCALWSDFRGQLDKSDLIAALLKGDPEHRYAAAARGLDLRKVWEGSRQ
jgi:hypothetical protein